MLDDSDGIDCSPSLEKLGIIYLGGEVDDASSESVCKRIIEFNHTKLDHIQMIINSPGGEVAGGFAIIDIMEWSKLPIYTTGLGLIASVGLMIFMAGEKGHRVVTHRTEILSHRFSTGMAGKHSELIAQGEGNKMTHERILNHYKRYTNVKTTKGLEKYLLKESDTFLTATEAVKLGIADKISKR